MLNEAVSLKPRPKVQGQDRGQNFGRDICADGW